MPTFWKHDLLTRYDAKADAAAAAALRWRAVCRVVDGRDKRRCRCCGKASDPNGTGLTTRGHRHHIVYRSAGGADLSSNLVSLCSRCHNDEHRHRLRVDGDADVALTFWRMDDAGTWFISKQEIAPGVALRD